MSEQEPMVEATEQETDEQPQFNPEELEAEELAKYIDDPESYVPPQSEDEEVEEETQEPVTDDSGDEELDAAVDDVEAEEEAEPSAETDAPELTEEDLARQERELELEELRTKAKHFESLVGRDAGKIGYLEQQLKALQERVSAPPVSTDPYQDTPVSDPAILKQIEDMRKAQENVLSHAVAQAVQGAAMEFKSAHAEDMGDDAFVKDFAEALQQSKADFDRMYTGSDPSAAAAEVKLACETAFFSAKRKQLTRMKEELAKRSVDSSEKLRAKKRAMSVAKPPSTKPKPKREKTPEEMTAEELAELINSM